MNILYVYTDRPEEWNCSEWRCLVPYRAIKEDGKHTVNVISLMDFKQNKKVDLVNEAEVIFLQRSFFFTDMPAILRLRNKGKKIILDFDDGYDAMPTTVNAYPFWFEGANTVIKPDGTKKSIKFDPVPIEQIREVAKIVDAVSSPSETILKDWEKYGVKTVLIPNYIEGTLYEEAAKEKKDNNGVVIGWGGSHSHFFSFKHSEITAGLTKIVKEFKHVTINLNGNVAGPLYLLNNIRSRIKAQTWVDYRLWPSRLAAYDIGLIPLYGAYDKRRSWIKALEYATMGIPWISSDTDIYREIPGGIYVKNRKNEWYSAMKEVVENLAEYKKQDFDVSKFYMENNVDNLIKIFESV